MNRYLCFGFVILSGVAHAGLFGPSDYNECVIDGLKNLKSKELAPGIYSACMSKFPEKQSRQDREDAAKKTALLKKCGIDESDQFGKWVFLGKSRPAIGKYINNLKSLKLDSSATSYKNTISFQNNNQIGISAIAIGFGLAKNKNNICSYEPGDYKAVLYCAATDTDQGVGSNAYGTLECDPNVKNFRKDSYCIIGLSPKYNKLIPGLAATMDEMGLCQ